MNKGKERSCEDRLHHNDRLRASEHEVSYRSLNEHGSLVTHLTHNVWQTDWLVGLYQTHSSLHCYQHASSTNASTATVTDNESVSKQIMPHRSWTHNAEC